MTLEVTPFASTGVNPRHLLMSPKGDRLYITNAGSGTVSKVDTGNGEVVGEATVGADPRSMAMSPNFVCACTSTGFSSPSGPASGAAPSIAISPTGPNWPWPC